MVQFSLRALFVLMLVAAAYFAGFSTARKLDERAILDAREKGAAEAREAAKVEQESAFQAAMRAGEIASPRP